MLERTDHPLARWHLVQADSKRYARVAVVEQAIAEIERGMRERGFEAAGPPAPARRQDQASRSKSRPKPKDRSRRA